MAKSIKELQSNAENLMEQGRDAQNRVQTYTREVLTGQSRVVSAQAALDEASRTDENGNPKGDVMAAQAALSMARQMLAESRNHLEQARAEVRRVNRSKRDLASTLEGYSRAEKSNLEKLRELQKRAFGNSVNAAVENILSRFKLSEKIRVELLRSIGLDASEETESAEAAALRYEYGNEIIERSLGFAAERRVKGEDYIPPVSAPVGGGLSSVTAPPIAQGKAREPSAKAGQPSGQEKKTGSSRNSPPSAADALTPNTNDPNMAAAPEATDSKIGKLKSLAIMRDFCDQNIRAHNLPSDKKADWLRSGKKGTGFCRMKDDTSLKIYDKATGKYRKMSGRDFNKWMRKRYKTDKVRYFHGEPDFSPFVSPFDKDDFNAFLREKYGRDAAMASPDDVVEGSVTLGRMSVKRRENFANADAMIAAQLGVSPKAVKAYMKSRNLTWHECGDLHTMQAVPSFIHQVFNHSAGISLGMSIRAAREYFARRGFRGSSVKLYKTGGVSRVLSGESLTNSVSQVKSGILSIRKSLFKSK